MLGRKGVSVYFWAYWGVGVMFLGWGVWLRVDRGGWWDRVESDEIEYLSTAWLALLVEAATKKLLVHGAGVVSLAYIETGSAVALPGRVVVTAAAAAVAR